MKLVRDRIPEIIFQSGKQCKWHEANFQELKESLYKKLDEELQEFIENPSQEEAADMYEVLRTICWLHQISMESVIEHASYKRSSKGGFHEGIILEEVEGG